MNFLTDEEYKAVGIKPESGHRLQWESRGNASYYRWMECECGDGIRLFARHNSENGKYYGRHKSEYMKHIQNTKIPHDTFVHVGQVHKKRVVWNLNVFTVYHPDAMLYAHSDRWKSWLGRENNSGNYIWVLGAEKNRKNSCFGIYTTRHDAVMKALKILEREEQNGHTVIRNIELDGQIEANTVSITNMLSEFLIRADDSLNSGSDFSLLQQMDEMLALVPLIQTKADMLRSKLNLANLATFDDLNGA